MDHRIQEVLYLTRCSLSEEMPELSGKQDWEGIFGLAAKMSITPFVQYALKLGKGLDCPRETYDGQMQGLRKKAMGRVMAAKELERMQGELEALGIRTAVVKGQALAAAYRHPELRVGCDIDLYVDEKKERAVYEWAREKGYRQERRVKGTHHGKIIHPVLGLIELHVSLCSADEALVESSKAGDALLRYPVEPFCTLDNCGSRVTTIGMTDHMLFIINHMVNHYLHGEAQVRMLADVNAFFARYWEEMDLKRLEGTLRQLRYECFFSAVLEIGNRYLGFSHGSEWIHGATRKEAEELLLDFCQGDFEKESALKVYDEYCKGTLPSGWKAVIFKLRILKINVRTALQLRHQMTVRSMAAIGWQRMRNMFSHPSGQEPERGVSPETKRRLGLIKKLGMLD